MTGAVQKLLHTSTTPVHQRQEMTSTTSLAQTPRKRYTQRLYGSEKSNRVPGFLHSATQVRVQLCVTFLSSSGSMRYPVLRLSSAALFTMASSHAVCGIDGGHGA